MVLAIQQVDGAFIYPRIVGKSVGLPGVAVFCAVIVGGNVAGVLGSLLGVPVCALLYALLREARGRQAETPGERRGVRSDQDLCAHIQKCPKRRFP